MLDLHVLFSIVVVDKGLGLVKRVSFSNVFFTFLFYMHLAVALPFDPLWRLKFGAFGIQNGAKSASKLVNKIVCIFVRFGDPFWLHFGSLLGTQNCSMNSLEYNRVPCSFDLGPCSFDLGPRGSF